MLLSPDAFLHRRSHLKVVQYSIQSNDSVVAVRFSADRFPYQGDSLTPQRQAATLLEIPCWYEGAHGLNYPLTAPPGQAPN